MLSTAVSLSDSFDTILKDGYFDYPQSFTTDVSTKIEYCIFHQCHNRDSYGGALFIRLLRGECLLNNNLFVNCTSYKGGGVAFFNVNKLSLNENCVTMCTALHESHVFFIGVISSYYINSLCVLNCLSENKTIENTNLLSITTSAKEILYSNFLFSNFTNNNIIEKGDFLIGFSMVSSGQFIFSNIINCSNNIEKCLFSFSSVSNWIIIHVNVVNFTGDVVFNVIGQSYLDVKNSSFVEINPNKNIANSDGVSNLNFVCCNFYFSNHSILIPNLSFKDCNFDSDQTYAFMNFHGDSCDMSIPPEITTSTVPFIKGTVGIVVVSVLVVGTVAGIVVAVVIVLSKRKSEKNNDKLFYNDTFLKNLISQSVSDTSYD